MSFSNDELIQVIRESVRLNPQNVVLRKHLADLLLKAQDFTAAESEFQQALALAPEDFQIKIGLAAAFFGQSKISTALVIVETMLQDKAHPLAPQILILAARLYVQANEIQQAAQAYRQAIQKDPTLADSDLESSLMLRQAQTPLGPATGTRQPAVPLDDRPDALEAALERPHFNFSDVGGMESLKEEIRLKIIHPLQHPELYKAYGKPIGGGILMYGPPGCGKTYLAKATAGEVRANFINVGIHDILDMYIGQSEHKLHELFELARHHRPCVLFFDEVDALGANRSDMRHSAGRQLINQFLAELDGAQTSNDGVLILAATNAPWHLDAAFRRPGRFDRILFVPPPDAEARASILQIMLKNKPIDKIDYNGVAKKTEQFSGADLKAVVDVAVEKKLGEAMKKGAPTPIVTSDLLQGAKTIRPSTKEWFGAARNYALYSNQSGIYDEILAYLKL